MSGLLPVHQVWGEPEILSCYGSSDTPPSQAVTPDAKPQTEPKVRKLPAELEQYVNGSVVKHDESSWSYSSSSNSAAKAQLEASSDDQGRPPEAVHEAIPQSQTLMGSRAESRESHRKPRPVDDSSGAAMLGTASLGSEYHWRGGCKPCLYLSSNVGCLNGWRCKFCHLPHHRKNRPRPCKATRMQCKQIATMLDTVTPDPEERLEVTKRLGAKSSYMRTILQGKQRQLEDDLVAKRNAEAESEGQSFPQGQASSSSAAPQPNQQPRSSPHQGLLSL